MALWCSDILMQWYISFVYISSSYLIFVISLCSAMIPLELGSRSNMSRETPYFLGLELRGGRRRECTIF